MSLTSVGIQNQENTEPYQNFINSLKSQETKQAYKICLLKYLKHYNTTIDGLLAPNISKIEKMIIDYILELRKQKLSSSYINLNFCVIKHFYYMNDVRINKEKLSKFSGEPTKMNVNRGYEDKEIKLIFDLADLRMKVIILIFASTGIRLGALPDLRLSNIEKKEDKGVYKFTIYENTKDQYITFCNPECARHLDSYLNYRTRSGEKLNSNSPLIREQFDIHDIEQIRKQGRPISKRTIARILDSLLIKSGLRIVNHNYTSRERQLIPIVHGFRKFFTTQLVNSKVNPEIREMLLGHSIGLASAYYKPTEDEMLSEYEKAIDSLTIDPTKRLEKKVEKLEIEKNSFEILAARIKSIENKLKK